jgi:LysM repeat protein
VRTSLRAATSAALTAGLLAAGATAASADQTHEVESGDTLASIARQHDQVSSWQDLAAANDKLNDPNLIFPGQVLQVAAPGDAAATEPAETSQDDAAAAATTVDLATWEALAECESSGDWSINTGNGYYGGLQFLPSSWEAVGGQGMPHEASKAEQIQRAELLLAEQGWGAWPACSSQLGLR